MSTPPHPTRVTELLCSIRSGRPGAHEELLPLVYGELLELARGLMVRERADHTLQPTALVHEAWLRLGTPGAIDRPHFLAVAAVAMRNVLVDHARARGASKRVGNRERLPLDGVVANLTRGRVDLVDLDHALERLAATDAQLARIVELRFFGGLTLAETGDVLELTVRQVDHAWSLARAWLHREMRLADHG